MPRDDNEATEIDLWIGKLHAAFGKSADEVTLEAYADGLEDLPVRAIAEACRLAIRSQKFVPTVSELRIIAGFDVTIDSRIMIAWGELNKAMSLHGPYPSIRFNDPPLNQTIQDLGGWVVISDTPMKDWDSHFRHRFITTYKANVEARRGTMSAQLGINAMANVAQNMDEYTKPPIEVDVGLPKLDRISYDPPKIGYEKRLGLSNIAGLLKDATKENKP